LIVANVSMFLNSCKEDAWWWFWWTETYSILMSGTKVLCLVVQFVCITIQQSEQTNERYCEIKNKLLQLLFSVHNLVYCLNITHGGFFGSSAADRTSQATVWYNCVLPEIWPVKSEKHRGSWRVVMLRV
jgi:hypothetical protein